MLALPSARSGSRVVLACLAGAALLLAACEEDGGETDTGDDADTTTTVTSTATEETTPEVTETATEEATEEATGTGTAAAGESDATVQISEEGDLAPYLVGPDGMTLYTFANDEPGTSNCDESCLANWPPLTVEDGEEPTAGEDVDGELGIYEHEDGTMQVTYNEMPLYYFVQDQEPGDTTGHEVADVWFVATPDLEPGEAGGETTPTGTPAG